MKVKIGEISNSTKFSAREEVNCELIARYAELLESGIELPPITVHQDAMTGKYLILDGFHTYHAALKIGAESIEVEVTNKVTELDCFVEGVRKNSQHGQPLTSKDRRRNIIRILSFDESWEWSNQVIAKIVGTSDRTIANIKNELPSPKISGMNEVKCFRNGKPHVVTVSNRTNNTNDNSFHTESADSPSSSITAAQGNNEGNNGGAGESESQESTLPDEQKILLIDLMKRLQQRCLSYTRAYDAVNDGSEVLTSSFLDKLNAQLAELRNQTESTTILISEIKEKVCASN